MDLRNREDKICIFLAPHLSDYVFDELSDNYLEKAGIADILTGVPVPIKKTEMTSLTTLNIARNMAFVIGCDPQFKYCQNYVDYILRTFGVKFAEALISEGVEGAAKNDFDFACIDFRGALLVDPESADALYCYGRACKDSYEIGEEESYVARYKAESIEAFEELTIQKPDFDMGYYFLGYGYLNLGLYIKAKLTWEEFMKLATDDKLREEIQGRLDVLDDPVEIEKGYNLILSGKYNEGVQILEAYTDGDYKGWWPLWHYLGIAYKGLDRVDDAIAAFKEVLKLSPSNIDTMEELIELYRFIGDEAMTRKYTDKVALIKENIEKDRAEKDSKLS